MKKLENFSWKMWQVYTLAAVTIFMIGAIAGVVVYLTQPNQNLGTIIVLIAMFFKIIECALRFIR